MVKFELARLAQDIDRLSSAERRVARSLIEGYPFIALRGIHELASFANVSAPTVIRFARRLGFSGYVDLQRAIVDALESAAQEVPPAGADLDADSEEFGGDRGGPSVEDPATATLLGALANLQRLASSLDKGRMQECVDLLSDPSNRVLGLGGCWSQPMAAMFIYLLNHLRSNVALLQDSQIPMMDQIVDLGGQIVLFVLDFDLYQRNVIAAARAIKSGGGKVILVTDHKLSPIADFADIALPVPVEIGAPLSSSVTIDTLLEMILSEVAARMGPGIALRISKIQKLRQSVNQLVPIGG